MSKRLFELLDGQAETEDLLSELMRRGAERLLQQALEAEVTDFLGRARYERSDEESPVGYRNGYRDRTIKTAEGRLKVRRPRVRETDEPFESRLLARIDGLEERIRRMALEMYVRGLSTRDIADISAERRSSIRTGSRCSPGRASAALPKRFMRSTRPSPRATFRSSTSSTSLSTGCTKRCAATRAIKRFSAPGRSARTAPKRCCTWPAREARPKTPGRPSSRR